MELLIKEAALNCALQQQASPQRLVEESDVERP